MVFSLEDGQFASTELVGIEERVGLDVAGEEEEKRLESKEGENRVRRRMRK